MSDAVEATYNSYTTQGGASGNGLTNKNFAKLCKDCGLVDGKKITSADMDIDFSKLKTKQISYQQFRGLIAAWGKKRFPNEPDKIFELVANRKPLAKGTTKTSKTGGVEKMTDASLYTGAHKSRFDADGKGKGIDGRVDRVENTGYVGNYKGEGTYKGTD